MPVCLPTAARRLVPALSLAALSALHVPTWASEGAQRAIEQALTAAQDAKKGVTLYVAGQAIGGGVVKLEPGQWVELRSQQYGRIVVRLDRIDALAMP